MSVRLDTVLIRKDGGAENVSLLWDCCVAAGYTGRDQKNVLAHVEELRRIGVPAPSQVPAMYWVEPDRVSSTSGIGVIGDKTSGEGEVFLARDHRSSLYVTVASDHTDRALETVSVAKAKQVCSKVVGALVWRVEDVRDHWDDLELRTWVDGVIYQEGTLGEMLPPERLLELAGQDLPSGASHPALFSGTLPILADGFRYGGEYVLSLMDPVLKREIRHGYRVQALPDRN